MSLHKQKINEYIKQVTFILNKGNISAPFKEKNFMES